MKPVVGTKNKLIKVLIDLEDDKKYELKEYKEKRSLNANAYFHLLINELAKNQKISNEEMKIKMNLSYGTLAKQDNAPIGMKLPKGTNITTIYPYAKWYKEDTDNCDCYLLFKRTSELDSREMYQLLCGVVQECKQLGIETKEDKEIKRLIEEMER